MIYNKNGEQYIIKKNVNLILSHFKSREIWTRYDLEQLTGLEQSKISEVMVWLEKQGIICWTYVEGMDRIKFYSLVNYEGEQND